MCASPLIAPSYIYYMLTCLIIIIIIKAGKNGGVCLYGHRGVSVQRGRQYLLFPGVKPSLAGVRPLLTFLSPFLVGFLFLLSLSLFTFAIFHISPSLYLSMFKMDSRWSIHAQKW